MKLLKHNHVDISKVISHFDMGKAQDFKKRNASFHKHVSVSCCTGVHKSKRPISNRAVYIPEAERTVLEKTIDSVVGPHSSKPGGWLYRSLPKLLDTVDQAFNRIVARGRSEGYECDPATEKEILGRCLMECVNKLAFEEVKHLMMREEQSYSKQPLLVAHPSHIKGLIAQTEEDEYQAAKISGYRLDQLPSSLVSGLLDRGHAIHEGFLEERDTVSGALRRLELLEMEGKFEASR